MINRDCWYAVYTYPNNEKKVSKELNRREITNFLPLRKEVRQWSDRKNIVELPLFPSYVFVKVSPREMWRVLMVDGVVRFISFAEGPAVVKESEVELIKTITTSCNAVNNEDYLAKGEEVQVRHGPLKGLVGKVSLSRKGITKLYIELDTMQQTVSIEIDTTLLERLQDHAAEVVY
jgi:transcription antitermination factor NusG